MLVSVVITNYNYERYLAECIDSVLSQSWSEKEVIVVDDGSTDRSAEVIREYGNTITAIFKENGGQCSAANEGFAASHGDIVIFLDSDDYLLEGAITAFVEPAGKNRSVSKCQGYLVVIDEAGRPTGRTIPKKLSASGNYREMTLQYGPSACRSAYTSGNAWARWFLEQVMPLPVSDFKSMGVDGSLNSVSTLFGRTESINAKVAAYRIHGANQGPVNTTFIAASLRRRLRFINATQQNLLQMAIRQGYAVQSDTLRKWKKGWRYQLLNYAVNTMEGLPQNVSFREFVQSPFYSCHTSSPKALFLSVLLAVLWFLPVRPSLALARQMLNLRKPVS